MRCITFITIIILPLCGYAQSADQIRRQADDETKAGRYESAIALYQDALRTDDQLAPAYMGLADTYRLSFQYTHAEGMYRKVRNTWSERFPLSIFYYGLMLKLNGNFDAASGEFSAFINVIGDTGRYGDFVEQAYVEKAGADLAMFTVDRGAGRYEHPQAPVNTPFNDFSPELAAEDLLILTSGRGKPKDLRYGESFMDQYAFREAANGWNEVEFTMLDRVNGKFHEGNGTFSSDQSAYYYTSCGDISPNCRILVTRRSENGEWSKPVPLGVNVNKPGSDTKQPALSVTGDTLFFVSDRSGGAGRNDIWMSKKIAGRWGPAENMVYINTSFNEVSPRLIANHLLVFSSEGHQSYGGLDLYILDISEKEGKLVNLGAPLSSSRDDAYAVIGESRIFWSSNREGGSGNFDIYFLSIDAPVTYLRQLLESSPSALRSAVGKKEIEQLKESKKNLAKDPFVYEALTDRQKQLIQEVIVSRRAGRPLPSELEYLDDNEKKFILKVANEQMSRTSED